MGPCCSDRDQNPAVTPSTLPTKHTGTGALALPRHPVPAGLPARLRPPLPRLRPCGCSTSWSPGPNGSWGARQEGGCSPRLLLRSSSSSSSPRGPAWVIGVLGVEVKHGGRGSEARRFPKKKSGPEHATNSPQHPGRTVAVCTHGCHWLRPWCPPGEELPRPHLFLAQEPLSRCWCPRAALRLAPTPQPGPAMPGSAIPSPAPPTLLCPPQLGSSRAGSATGIAAG